MTHMNLPASRKLKLQETPKCWAYIPMQEVNKFKFLSVENWMLKASSSKEPCTPNFSRLVKADTSWSKIEESPFSLLQAQNQF